MTSFHEEQESNALAHIYPANKKGKSKYCWCRSDEEKSPFIECSGASEYGSKDNKIICVGNGWFHLSHIGMTAKEAENINQFICISCYSQIQKINRENQLAFQVQQIERIKPSLSNLKPLSSKYLGKTQRQSSQLGIVDFLFFYSYDQDNAKNNNWQDIQSIILHHAKDTCKSKYDGYNFKKEIVDAFFFGIATSNNNKQVDAVIIINERTNTSFKIELLCSKHNASRLGEILLCKSCVFLHSEGYKSAYLDAGNKTLLSYYYRFGFIPSDDIDCGNKSSNSQKKDGYIYNETINANENYFKLSEQKQKDGLKAVAAKYKKDDTIPMRMCPIDVVKLTGMIGEFVEA